jgi:SAM-dependent methyltransferase
MPRLTEAFCNLCQQSISSVFLYQVRHWEIVRCPSCGLVFVGKQLSSPEEVAALYSENYFEGGVDQGYTDYRESEEVLRRQARRALRRLQRYRPAGRVLEIGCAYGFFLAEAQRQYEAEGVEISSFAARQAQQRGLAVQHGDFLELSFPPDRYDVVCLFDCIEHLVDPHAYLQKTHTLLKPQGVLALTTGDISSLYARLAGKHWRLMSPPQHQFYFSRQTLSRLLHQTGFELLEISYPWKLVPWPLMLYQLSPRLKALFGFVGRLPLGLYANLFDAMFVIARKRH